MTKTDWNRRNGQTAPKASPVCNPPVADSIAGRHCGGPTRLQRLWRSHCGQATVEYAIATGVLIALVVIMGLFLTTFGDYGERLLAIIASDYP